MRLESSRDAAAGTTGTRNAAVAKALAAISPKDLAQKVRTLAHPRHFAAQAEVNRRAGESIAGRLRTLGFDVTQEGDCRNVIALPPGATGRPLTLVGAHYDSVPLSPGADDNASAVAALLAAAAVVAARHTPANIGFVAFNQEEDDLRGSTEFVRRYLPQSGLTVRRIHVLEMVGFRAAAPGSQKTPPGLPIALPDTGDFLGLVGSAAAAPLIDAALTAARTYVASLTVLGLKLPPGAETQMPVLRRSDHAPFWDAGIPAVQWTDTAEFRNPHYHRPTDTPETLDYDFLADITRLLAACLLTETVAG